MKFLYIEDQPLNTRILSLFVEQLWGEELFCVETAEEGFDLLMEQDFDLVYMDINLPKMNGVDAVKYIRDVLKKPKIPIVMVSANTSENVIAKSYENGCRAYIKKPVNIGNLKEITEQVLKSDAVIPCD